MNRFGRASHRARETLSSGPSRPADRESAIPDRRFWIPASLWVLSLILFFDVVVGDFTAVGLLSFTTVGAFVAWRKPAHPLGWILLIDGLVWLGGAAGNHFVAATANEETLVTLTAAFFDLVGWIVGVGLVALAMLVFPNGRLSSGSAVVVARVLIAGGVVLAVAGVLQPGPLPSYPTIDNPTGVVGLEAVTDWAVLLGSVAFFGAVLASLLVIVGRYRSASGVELQQMRWLALSSVLMIIGFITGAVLTTFGYPGAPLANTLPMLTVPLAVGFAVLRYRLWDLDLVVGKTLKFALTLAIIVVIYVGLIAGFGGLIGRGTKVNLWLLAVATAAAAALLQPLLIGATNWAERSIFGSPLAPIPEVRICTMGGFRVERDRIPVSRKEWRSRKARQLLKILVGRRGQPIHREQLMEILWPEDSGSGRNNRLAVATSTVRTVLDPDHQRSGDHYVVSSDETLRLQVDHLTVDVEEFLSSLELATDGTPLTLDSALKLYRGEVFQEDLYEEWAQPLREEARHAYLSALTRKAASELGSDPQAAITTYMRLLEEDPWDESAHLAVIDALMAIGRHGEARRAKARYASRMSEIGIDPAM